MLLFVSNKDMKYFMSYGAALFVQVLFVLVILRPVLFVQVLFVRTSVIPLASYGSILAS